VSMNPFLPISLGAMSSHFFKLWGQPSHRAKGVGFAFCSMQRAVFHEPHPERVTDKGAVKSVREFLLNAGIVVDPLED
jgi:hypothetical protein